MQILLMLIRFTAGVASGMYISGVILLQSELSPPHFRGLMVGLASVAQSIGYTVAGWVGVAFYFADAGGAQWRIPFALTAVPAILAILALIKVPESPRWLIMKARTEEASRIIQKLHGGVGESSHQFGQLEIAQMKAQIQFETDNSVSWWTLLASKRFRVRALLTIIVSFIAQVTTLVQFFGYV
jgi:MFS family permease